MITKSYRKTPEIYPIDDVRVIDGDTLEATIRLPFDCSIKRRIRLRGWWAPERSGPHRASGEAAAALLAEYCKGKALWLHAPSCRLDRYGRVIGHLMHGERIVDPRDVLGSHQLTETEHKHHRDEALKAGGKNTAGRQTKRVLGHPDDTYAAGLSSDGPFGANAAGPV